MQLLQRVQADTADPFAHRREADLLVIEENPLQNLQVLYGTGALKLNDQNKPVRVGAVKYTIKDGIVYDAKKLLAAGNVQAAWQILLAS